MPTAVTVADRGTDTLPVSAVINKLPVTGVADAVGGAVNDRITVQELPAAKVLGSVLGHEPPEIVELGEVAKFSKLSAPVPELESVTVVLVTELGATLPSVIEVGLTLTGLIAAPMMYLSATLVLPWEVTKVRVES
jgi:hypothetical protein